MNPQLELIDALGKLTGEDNVELDKTIYVIPKSQCLLFLFYKVTLERSFSPYA
jgi:hypothetical protein